MTPLDTVVAVFRGAPVDTDRLEPFALVVCQELAEYSYGPDGVVFVGWAEIEEAAGDYLDKDTGTLTITPFDGMGGLIRLSVPQFEMGSSKTAEFMFPSRIVLATSAERRRQSPAAS